MSVRTRVALTIVVAVMLVLRVVSIAHAHATLVSSEPAAGSHLSASPTRVRLVFSEALDPSLARLSLVDAHGTTMRLNSSGDPHDVHALIAPVDAQLSGAYRLAWHVVSDDGHPVSGSFVFTVGSVTPIADTANVAPITADSTMSHDDNETPAVAAIARAAAVGTTMALSGLLLFFVWATPQIGRTSLAARAIAWLSLASPALFAVHGLLWMMHVAPDHQLTSQTLSAILSSRVGEIEAWRTGLALLGAWAVWLARRHRLALAFVAASLVVSGLTGHSGAIDMGIAAPTKAIHLLAGGLWLGGLCWLVVLAHAEDSVFQRQALRVSASALVAVVVVAASGVLQAVLFLPSLSELVHSTYGALVLGKATGLLLLVGFGAYHRFAVLPRIAGDGDAADTRSSFRRSLVLEIMLMSVVILLSGWLAYMSPGGAMKGMVMPSSSTR